MNHAVYPSSAPAGSRIAARLAGADFADAWSVRAAEPQLSALGQFLRVAAATPRWVENCMRLRNRVVRLFGLKDLGGLSDVATRPPEAFLPGDRVGIFTLLENGEDEVLLGDSDKHLDVVLSVHRARQADGGAVLTLTTVVHVHNLLGRLYMLPVTPMHRLIAPATLRAAGP
ncbi:DUF2867 domain-containing protein [Chromobacterium sp. CV08]|uniref:DUF2867 domain-containing protein n=1 Tax=Chromobacterium sp. CV08 TaxID=3133274 RepID=UPI003DA8DB34